MKKLGFVKRRLIRAEVLRFLREDPEVRTVIARCARSVAKDYIEDWAELEKQESWQCPVCGKHSCDGPRVHGVELPSPMTPGQKESVRSYLGGHQIGGSA